MTGEDLVEKVLAKVQDPSISEDDVFDLLNDGLLSMAEDILFSDLEASGTVSTELDSPYLNLPDNYHVGLYRCVYVPSGAPVDVLNSRTQMMERNSNLTTQGSVRQVCVVGSRLMYQDIPAEVSDLELFYYRLPATITGSSAPEGFPPSCRARGERALVHYATGKLFEDIEDGIEGAKVNTDYHLGWFESIKSDIKLKLNESVSRPAPPVVRGCYR